MSPGQYPGEPGYGTAATTHRQRQELLLHGRVSPATVRVWRSRDFLIRTASADPDLGFHIEALRGSTGTAEWSAAETLCGFETFLQETSQWREHWLTGLLGHQQRIRNGTERGYDTRICLCDGLVTATTTYVFPIMDGGRDDARVQALDAIVRLVLLQAQQDRDVQRRLQAARP